MSSADSNLVDALEALKAQSAGIRTVFLSSSQGRFLGSTQLGGLERVQMAAISAASMAIADKCVGDLRLGTLSLVHVAADGGSILLLSVGAKAILSILLEADAEMDPILAAARRVADRLRTFV